MTVEDWRMKLYRLSDSKTPVDAADFKLVNQHARPHGSAAQQFLASNRTSPNTTR